MLWNPESLPVTAIGVTQQAVRLSIADDFFLHRIEVQRAAQTIRRVRQMHQRAGNVAFLDGRGDVLRLAVAQGFDEVREGIGAAAFVTGWPAFISEPSQNW